MNFRIIFEVNMDGISDLVTTNINRNNFSILLGNGDGTFMDRADFITTQSPRDVLVRDINNDHLLDLVSLSSILSTKINIVSVHLGNGKGVWLYL